MARRVLSVISNIIAGFFVYMSGLLSFMSAPSPHGKLGMVLGFSAPAAVFLMIGIALGRFQTWRTSMAAVLLGGLLPVILVIWLFIAVLQSPEVRQYYPQLRTDMFGDYVFGLLWNFPLAVIGIALAASEWFKSRDAGSQTRPN